MKESFRRFEKPPSIEHNEQFFRERPIKQVVPLPEEICWPDGSKLIAKRLREKIIVPLEALSKGEIIGSLKSYTYQLIYRSPEGKEIILNGLFESKIPIVIIGGDSFFAMDILPRGNPKDSKIFITLEPKYLEEDKLHLLAVFHELGHSFLCQETDLLLMKMLTSPPEYIEKTLKNPQYKGIAIHLKRVLQALLPEIQRIKGNRHRTRGEEEILNILNQASKESDFFKLRQLFYNLRNYWRNFEIAVRVFHERMAWAFALKVIRRERINLLKRNQEILDYIDSCLESYERRYKTSFRKLKNF